MYMASWHYRNTPRLIYDCSVVCKVQLFEIFHDCKHCCHITFLWLSHWPRVSVIVRQISGRKGMATVTMVPGIIRSFSHPQHLQHMQLPVLYVFAVIRPCESQTLLPIGCVWTGFSLFYSYFLDYSWCWQSFYIFIGPLDLVSWRCFFIVFVYVSLGLGY